MQRKEWTGPEVAKLLDLWSRDYTARQIAGILSRTVTSVQGKLRDIKAPSRENLPVIERIKRLCVIDGDPAIDCWIWIGCITGSKAKNPKMAYEGRGANPRMLAMKEMGRWPAGARYCYANCEDKRCVSPFHGIARNTSQHVRWQFKEGYLGNAAHVAAIRQQMRKRSALTEADIQAMRESEESHSEIARRYGMSVQHIQKIRAGLRWADNTVRALVTK